MAIYPLTVKVVDELCLALRRGANNHYETLPYIPGRVLWGMLASLTGVQPGKRPNDDFLEIFYSGDVIFSNLYPSDSDETGHRSAPVPLSARTLKTAPGFKSDVTQRDYPPAGMCDWLYGIPEGVIYENYIRYERFYSYSVVKTVDVPVSFTVHHERHTQRGITNEGKLFSRTNIPYGTVFLGFIRASGHCTEKIEKLLDASGISNGTEVPFGRKPGRVFIKKAGSPETHFFRDSIQNEPAPIFTITCYSDTIIMDDYHRYLGIIGNDHMETFLANTVKECRLVEPCFSAKKTVYGWNGAYQRPAENETAIAMGSAFRYSCSLKNGKTASDLASALKWLQSAGIGLRRQEGFGEIRINDPFHENNRPGDIDG